MEHFATTTAGGAGTAVTRLDDALNKAGGVDSNITSLFDGKYSSGYIRYVLNHLPIGHKLLRGQLDRKFTPTWLPNLSHQTNNADVVHLHWVAGFLSPRTIREFEAPIVWTLHDMWPLTGGCHHAENCDGFIQQCGQCPALNSTHQQDISTNQLQAYQAALSGKKIYYIAPSKWMAAKAEDSSIVQGPVKTIPNGIDTELFSPNDKELARKELSIPTEANIILTGGVNMKDDHIKGGDLLREALGDLKNNVKVDQTIVLQFGNGTIDNIPFKTRSLGWVNPEQLPQVYSLADVMAVPSRYESFGQTAAEASACGTPVVAFDTSGLRDVVIDGETGLLAKCYDIQDFSTKLAKILTSRKNRKIFGRRARDHAVTSWSFETVSSKHTRLYRDLFTSVEDEVNKLQQY
ncbi:glycosyltransferase [Haladaptatus sp. CMSO5]|uniref:glycosyltransferase n=1 Tax=Haladaptatus sp. CMSO5 TaxID=3120514 RepID=UPI002FCDF107